MPLDVSARGVFIQKGFCLEGGSVQRSLHPLSQRSPFKETPHPSVDRMTNRCKNITSPQIRWQGGNNEEKALFDRFRSSQLYYTYVRNQAHS